MKIKLKSIFLIITLFLFYSGKKIEDEKILLKLNLEAGQVFKYKSLLKENIKYERYGKLEKIKHLTGFGYKFTVQESEQDSINNLAAVFKSAYYEGNYGSQKIHFNSSSVNEDDYSGSSYTKSLEALIGEGFFILVDDHFKVAKLDGFDEFLDNVVIKMDNYNLSIMESYRKYLKQQYTNEGLVEFKGGICVYPDYAVGVGDSWGYEANISTIVKAKIKYNYTITNIRDNKVYIEENSVITPNTSGKAVKYNVKGYGTGKIVVDRQSGMVISAKLSQDIEGEIKVRGKEPYPYFLNRKINIKQL